jgi:enoyl-CoA hydratase/3-hydroxyacyl-CoA dehydrogenase
MTEQEEKNVRALIPEPVPLLESRKGGVANLILASLLLEATRMVDDGMDVPHIEAAGKKAFGISKGFLKWMDDEGTAEAIAFLDDLSDTSDDQEPLTQVYDNFFTPGKSSRAMLEKYSKADDQKEVKWISEEETEKEADDLLLLDLLVKRFRAVAFMVSVEVVDAGLIRISDVETFCSSSLGWEKGPFAMMNSMGVQEALRIVTERMELSHRKEINFPVPQLLIVQAQRNEPWPVKSKK